MFAILQLMLQALRQLFAREKSDNFFPPVTKPDGTPTRVFVGVSGGVDSSVSAAELVKKGYDMTGVFIKTYYPPEIECDWREERLDAMRVCEHLGIPFLECDMEQAYKEQVFDYMIDSYKQGITPNPDIFCNKYVKFGGFLEWAKSHDCDYIAMGHYAQHFVENDEHHLVMGADTNKDQTYFLYQLTQHQLNHTIFPIGHWDKQEVRKRAKKHGLFTADKQDSQGICFVGPVEMRQFLAQYIDEQPGEVLSESGEVIGSHSGAFFLTIGQRSGFEIAPEHRTPKMPRMYIVAKDAKANTVTVSPNIESYNPERITITDTSWINSAPQVGDRVDTRIRHRGQLLQATLEVVDGDNYIFGFKQEAHSGVAEGQSLVIYKDSICLGGGIVI
jgi:tRNA-specific 2-thiouridylase